MRVFAQPVVALALVGWALNDHVFKERFHNAITGKLSDLLAMVVFPLVVAAVAERFVKRPALLGVVVTAMFFSAINLSHTANDVTERALSLVLPYPQLWPDPTDLIVLPALGVALWAWSHPVRSWTSARRNWSRVVFAGALATTMATSPPESDSSESFSGVVVLDEDNPVVEVPFELEVDGEPSEDFDYIVASAEVSALGLGPVGNDVLPNDGVKVSTVDNDGAHLVRYELVDLSFAPAEVAWSVIAAREQKCGMLRCDSADLVLALDPPPEETLPEGIVTFAGVADAAPDTSLLQVERWRISVTSQDAELRLVAPADAVTTRLRVATASEVIEPFAGGAVALPVPDDCVGSCELDLWVSGYDLPPDIAMVRLYDTSGTSTVTVHAVEMVASEVAVAASGPEDLERFAAEEFAIAVEGLDAANEAIAQADGWSPALSALVVFSLDLESDDALTVQSGYADGLVLPRWPYAWADQCCQDRGSVRAHHVDNDKGRGDAVSNAVVRLSATVWAPVPVDGITLEVAWS